MSNLFRYRKDHPYRPPNWRWERARALKEHRGKTPGLHRDDPWVYKAFKFQVELDSAQTDIDYALACEKAGDIGLAFDIWSGDPKDAQKGNNNSGRWELEARLLAKQDYESIAYRMCVPDKTIEAYERLFFNVSDRLGNQGYIMHQVIGDALHRNMTDRDFPAVVKAYAYFTRAPKLVDFLVTTFTEAPAEIKDITSFLLGDGRLTTVRKSALAARMLGLSDSLTKIQTLDINRQICADENSVGTPPADTLQGGLQAMMGHIQFLIGKQKGQTVVSAAEPRAHELLALAGGAEVQIEDVKFPEAGK